MSGLEPEVILGCRPNLLVSDLCGSLRFYSDALGFRVGWEWSDRQGRFLPDGERCEPGEPGTALVGRDRAQIILTQVAGVHTTWLHLDVHASTQVDRLFEEWGARGVGIAEPPQLRAWGMYEMRLHDPDGHVLRVSSPSGSTPD
jgi:catechol 2,3-dioxygenase-like lactoylglutathione lyase family enzyme